MTQIKSALATVRDTLIEGVALVAVSKTKPVELLQEAYEAGQRDFGENKVQEMALKAEAMPKDIRWHMIGHVQTNKIKYMASFVHLVHGVDREKVLKELDKQAKKSKPNDQLLVAGAHCAGRDEVWLVCGRIRSCSS